jgi:hypothetical protein
MREEEDMGIQWGSGKDKRIGTPNRDALLGGEWERGS